MAQKKKTRTRTQKTDGHSSVAQNSVFAGKGTPPYSSSKPVKVPRLTQRKTR
jgi:hypothetical protein